MSSVSPFDAEEVEHIVKRHTDQIEAYFRSAYETMSKVHDALYAHQSIDGVADFGPPSATGARK